MQVVYLGSSPATQRRYGSPRMMRPVSAGSLGYGGRSAPSASHHGALYAQRSVDSHTSYTNQTKHGSSSSETKLRDSIPAMAKPVAIICLILNILCPGLGTFVSACTVFCCAVVRPSKLTKYRAFFTNVGVALLQFLTAFVFLMGWIWSIMWGAAFLEISDKHFKTDQTEPAAKSPSNNKIVKRPNDLKIKTKNNNLRAVKNDLKVVKSPTIVLHEPDAQNPPSTIEEEREQLVKKENSVCVVMDKLEPSSAHKPVVVQDVETVMSA